MSMDYTKMMNSSFDQLYGDDEDIEAIQFLTDPKTFRSFDEGLTIAIEHAGYTGDLEDAGNKSKYLFDRLKKIGSSTGIKTVKAWFGGSQRPLVQHSSRQRMYEICFALGLSMDDIYWFFNHVYFDRCFNCHNIQEAVYCFCLNNHLSYKEANQMIEEIENTKVEKSNTSESGYNYTQFVKDQIMDMHSKSEVIAFLVSQKSNFEEWNRSAYGLITKFYEEILGSQKSEKIVNKLRTEISRKLNRKDSYGRNELETENLDDCGLIIKELIWDAQHSCGSEDTVCDYLSEMLIGDPFSSAFFLKQLWINPTKSFKNTDIPNVISNNFPSAKVMSNVLDNIKMGKSESYDQIRKVLVLLHFYRFWCNVKIKNPDMMEYEPAILCDIYKDEANNCLFEAGYEPLYAGNPYDWIYLYCAQKEQPVDFLREIMGIIMDE